MNAKLAILIVVIMLALSMLARSKCSDPECWNGACAQCETGGL